MLWSSPKIVNHEGRRYKNKHYQTIQEAWKKQPLQWKYNSRWDLQTLKNHPRLKARETSSYLNNPPQVLFWMLLWSPTVIQNHEVVVVFKTFPTNLDPEHLQTRDCNQSKQIAPCKRLTETRRHLQKGSPKPRNTLTLKRQLLPNHLPTLTNHYRTWNLTYVRTTAGPYLAPNLLTIAYKHPSHVYTTCVLLRVKKLVPPIWKGQFEFFLKDKFLKEIKR